MSRVRCDSAALAVPYALKPRSRRRPMADEMLTIAPSPCSSITRHRGLREDERGRGVEVERPLEVAGAGVEERARWRAAGVVHDDVDAPELLEAGGRERLDVRVLVHVGRARTRARRPKRADVGGDGLELLRRPRREHDVGAGLGQPACGGRADAPARAGDDRDLAVHSESFEHARSSRARRAGTVAAHVGAPGPWSGAAAPAVAAPSRRQTRVRPEAGCTVAGWRRSTRAAAPVGRVIGTEDSTPLSFWVALAPDQYLQLDDVVVTDRPLPGAEGTVAPLGGGDPGPGPPGGRPLRLRRVPRGRRRAAGRDGGGRRGEHHPPRAGDVRAAAARARRSGGRSARSATTRCCSTRWSTRSRSGSAATARRSTPTSTSSTARAGAHVNISGVSGVATKTTYATFLLYSLFHSGALRAEAREHQGADLQREGRGPPVPRPREHPARRRAGGAVPRARPAGRAVRERRDQGAAAPR